MEKEWGEHSKPERNDMKYQLKTEFCIFDRKLNKMDLQTRKIEFIQEFLKLQSEQTIGKLENLLNKEKETTVDDHFKPMTEKELNDRIDQSESDFKNNRYKRTSELLTKYEQWNWKSFGRILLLKNLLNEPKILIKNPFMEQVESLLQNRTTTYRHLIYKNYKIIYSIDQEQGFIKIADVFDTRQYPEKIKRTK